MRHARERFSWSSHGPLILGRQRLPVTMTAAERVPAAPLAALSQEFPALSRDTIEGCVAGVAARFDGARAQAYLPVLVHRLARQHLRGLAEHSDHDTKMRELSSSSHVGVT